MWCYRWPTRGCWWGGQWAQASRDCGQPASWPLSTHVPPQGNQMSITFLEPVYPAPGDVHHGELQLVEVSGHPWSPRLRGLLPVTWNSVEEQDGLAPPVRCPRGSLCMLPTPVFYVSLFWWACVIPDAQPVS